ncbi:uncharacterized protein LOC109606595 [Aethina tumida]|uniref:uncharacterized protein LOC109606595 n=1 Tax=Aethina tumida TaxID=116153 RepID=UPI00214770D6|nr:uncharacterized protein LOC109606595 [Aethina tumida]
MLIDPLNTLQQRLKELEVENAIVNSKLSKIQLEEHVLQQKHTYLKEQNVKLKKALDKALFELRSEVSEAISAELTGDKHGDGLIKEDKREGCPQRRQTICLPVATNTSVTINSLGLNILQNETIIEKVKKKIDFSEVLSCKDDQIKLMGMLGKMFQVIDTIQNDITLLDTSKSNNLNEGEMQIVQSNFLKKDRSCLNENVILAEYLRKMNEMILRSEAHKRYLQDEVNLCRQQMRKSIKNFGILEESNKSYLATITSLEKENLELRKTIVTLKNDNNVLKKSTEFKVLSKLQQDRLNLKKTVANQERGLARMKSVISKSQSYISELKSQKGENMKLLIKCSDYNKQLKDFNFHYNIVLQNYMKYSKAIQKTKRKLLSLEDQNNNLKKELKNALEQLLKEDNEILQMQISGNSKNDDLINEILREVDLFKKKNEELTSKLEKTKQIIEPHTTFRKCSEVYKTKLSNLQTRYYQFLFTIKNTVKFVNVGQNQELIRLVLKIQKILDIFCRYSNFQDVKKIRSQPNLIII